MYFLHYGLGPIGLQTLALTAEARGLTLAGAVDIDPAKVGCDVGSLLGAPELGVRVVPRVADLPASFGGEQPGPAVALHAAGSRLVAVWPQLRELLDAGFSVVSTCEELAYPWHRHPELAGEIDEYARRCGRTVVGTGVNPGFVMDVLPLCVTAALGTVQVVRVRRAVDVATRRVPLQRKVGVGLSEEEFSALAATGDVGHVGLEESARLLAHGLGWQVQDIEYSMSPTVAAEQRTLPLGPLAAGQVDGLAQRCVARTERGQAIELDLTMRVGVTPVDEVVVAGDTELRMCVPGGLAGDRATAAIAMNCAKQIASLAPGLLTMAEVGLPRYVEIR